MNKPLETTRWDSEYKAGRYLGDPPIAFVATIINDLGPTAKKQVGLYVGCGNGRNFVPLINAGLNLRGLDISSEAIKQLHRSNSALKALAAVGDFAAYKPVDVFDYIIAIQVFQHGDKQAVNNYLQRSHRALKPHGRLYLRVNSVSTEIANKNHVIEGNQRQGMTIIYEAGPKKDMKIHFFSKDELSSLAEEHGFDVNLAPYEVTEQRTVPRTGKWTQWETIWQKSDYHD